MRPRSALFALGVCFSLVNFGFADDDKPAKAPKKGGKRFDPQEMLQKAREAFKKADHDNDEFLTREEFANVIPQKVFSNKPAGKPAAKTPPSKKPSKKGPPSLGIGAKPEGEKDKEKEKEEKEKGSTEEEMLDKLPPVDAKKVNREMDRIFKVADENGDGKLDETEYMKVMNNYIMAAGRAAGS